MTFREMKDLARKAELKIPNTTPAYSLGVKESMDVVPTPEEAQDVNKHWEYIFKGVKDRHIELGIRDVHTNEPIIAIELDFTVGEFVNWMSYVAKTPFHITGSIVSSSGSSAQFVASALGCSFRRSYTEDDQNLINFLGATGVVLNQGGTLAGTSCFIPPGLLVHNLWRKILKKLNFKKEIREFILAGVWSSYWMSTLLQVGVLNRGSTSQPGHPAPHVPFFIEFPAPSVQVGSATGLLMGNAGKTLDFLNKQPYYEDVIKVSKYASRVDVDMQIPNVTLIARNSFGVIPGDIERSNPCSNPLISRVTA